MVYQKKDFYFYEAKKKNYAARSVFKLEEINQKFRILKGGDQVLDLGAAPGSWSQYTSDKIGPKGRILGIDLEEVKLTLPNAIFLTKDINDLNLDEEIKKYELKSHFDVILSDMAPKTTGIRTTDQVRSFELCELGFVTATRFLKPKGHFVCKLFHSEAFEQFRSTLKKSFTKVEVLRPKSTRKESKEIFLIALQFSSK